MVEATNMYPNLNDQQQFSLKKINKIKDFIAEVRERELMSIKLSKYIAAFDYFDKSLFYLQQVVAFLLLHLVMLVLVLHFQVQKLQRIYSKQHEIKKRSIMKLSC